MSKVQIFQQADDFQTCGQSRLTRAVAASSTEEGGEAAEIMSLWQTIRQYHSKLLLVATKKGSRGVSAGRMYRLGHTWHGYEFDETI